MGERTIPVDLHNPGQVFGCLGLMEMAECFWGGAEGRFDWSAEDSFTLSVPGEADPIASAIDFLWNAEVSAEFLPGHAPDRKFAKWKLRTALREDPFLHSEIAADAADRAWTILAAHDRRMVVDHYADGSSRDALKFWAGAAGKPGARSIQDCLEAMRQAPRASLVEDPMGVLSSDGGVPLSGGMRLDWRRDYIAFDAGFSPNAHGGVVMLGFPLVELLAVIGLSNARPAREHRLLYRYGVAGGCALPTFLHRAALGASVPIVQGLSFRRFGMQLGWPGQEGQARCITAVNEIPNAAIEGGRT